MADLMAAIVAAAAFAVLVVVFVVPVLCDNRARRKQADAVEECQASPYWAGMKALLDEPYNVLPAGDNPKTGGRIASRPSGIPHQLNRGRTR